MPSTAQLEANQANARLSTGPRTPEGKAASSANARKDGLTAHTLAIPPDQQAAFDDFRAALHAELRPEGPLETEFFERLLVHGWNLRRARVLETILLYEGDTINSDEDAARLHRLARYRRELERSYDRAIAQLRQLQTQRAALLQQSPAAEDAVSTATPVAGIPRFTKRSDPFFLPLPVSRNEPNAPAAAPPYRTRYSRS